jgi:hypothetical protein
MTLTNVGFKGTVSDAQWSTLALLLGHDDCLVAQGDLRVTPSGTKGQYVLGTGGGYGDGVRTDNDAPLTFPDSPLNPANGQWYLIALNRKWNDAQSTTTVVVRNGPTTAAATPGGVTVPASLPATSTSQPGVDSDVPVCWLWQGSGSPTPIIVPLLLPSSASVPRKGTSAQRDALYAPMTGNVQGTRILQDRGETWTNARGTTDRYYAAYDATTNPTGARTPGWYPVAGALPMLRLTSSDTSGYQGVPTSTNAQVNLDAVDFTQGEIRRSSTTIVISQPGLYEVRGAASFMPGGNEAARAHAVTLASVATTFNGSNPDQLTYSEVISNSYVSGESSREVPLKAGDVLRLVVRQQSGATVNLKRGGDMRTSMSARYLGPVQA